MTSYTVSLKLVHMSCGECGIQFAIDEEKYNRCNDYGEGWYCPNGHSRVFSKPKNRLLEQQLKAVEQSNEYLRKANSNLHTELTSAKNKVRSEKAAKTRIKNRVKHGVCPCCNRTFKQLAAHMKDQHPEYVQS